MTSGHTTSLQPFIQPATLFKILKINSFIDMKQRFQRRIHKNLRHSLNLFDQCRQLITHTAWKVSRYGAFSGHYFPVFGLNIEIYSISIVLNLAPSQLSRQLCKNKLHKISDYWSRDMLNFDFFSPYFVYDFLRKMFLMLYSIKWPSFIAWLSLLLEILVNMFIAIVC